MLVEIPLSRAPLTSPADNSSLEELIAAHASCYAVALSMVLNGRGTPPEALWASADCTLDAVEEGFRRTIFIDLDVRGRAPGLDEEDFRSASRRDASVRINVSAEIQESQSKCSLSRFGPMGWGKITP